MADVGAARGAETSAGSPVLFGLVGLAIGLGLYLVGRLSGLSDTNADLLHDSYYLVVSPSATTGLAIALLAAGTGFVFSTEGGRHGRSALFALGLAVVLGLFGAGHLLFVAPAEIGRESSPEMVAIFATAVAAGIAIPFFRTVFQRGLAPTHYASLFEIAWNTLVIGLAAGIFAWIAYGVVAAAAGLFSVVGFSFLIEEIVPAGWFAVPFWFAAFGVGVGVIRAREGLILAGRSIVLALIRVVGPILLVAAIGFLAVFAVVGFGGLVDGFSPTILLTSVAIGGIVHLNAILGDGTEAAGPGRWSSLLARIQGFVIAALVAVAAVALALRIGQYGLTPARVYGAIVVGLAVLYGLVYAVCAVLPTGFALLRRANIALAGFAAGLALLSLTPLLNAETIAAQNQLDRIRDGRATDLAADLGALRFQMARPGAEALSTLRAEAEAAGDAERIALLDRIDALEGLWMLADLAQIVPESELGRLRADIAAKVVLHPAGAAWPESLMTQLVEEAGGGNTWGLHSTLAPCLTDKVRCAALVYEPAPGRAAVLVAVDRREAARTEAEARPADEPVAEPAETPPGDGAATVPSEDWLEAGWNVDIQEFEPDAGGVWVSSWPTLSTDAATGVSDRGAFADALHSGRVTAAPVMVSVPVGPGGAFLVPQLSEPSLAAAIAARALAAPPAATVAPDPAATEPQP